MQRAASHRRLLSTALALGALLVAGLPHTAAGSALAASPSAMSGKKICKSTVKTVHGKKKTVRVCKTVNTPPTSTPAPTATPTSTPIPTTPNPLTVTGHTDPGHASSATVPAKGGTVSATGADGTTYTLTIPDKALLADEKVTLVPLTGIDGFPFSRGNLAGVDIQPSGLFLLAPATLTIHPAHPIPVAEQEGFGYSGTGTDFHLEPIQRDPSTVTLTLLHFSGHGIGGATDADRQTVQSHPPTTIEDQIIQVTAMVSREHQCQLMGASCIPSEQILQQIQTVDRRMWNEQVLPLLTKATTDDTLLITALKAGVGWMHAVAVLGLDQTFAQEFATAEDLIFKALKNAFDRSRERCLTKNMPGHALRMLGIARMAALLGDESYDWMSAIKCVKFELDMDSTIHGQGSEFMPNFVGHVTVHGLKLGLNTTNPQAVNHGFYVEGKGQATYQSFSFTQTECHKAGVPVDGTIQASLKFIFDVNLQLSENVDPNSDVYDFPSNIVLTVEQPLVKETVETLQQSPCGGPPETYVFWQSAFNILYGGSRAILDPAHLRLGTPPVYLQAVFHRTVSDSAGLYGFTSVTEDTTWSLRHTPGS